MSEQSPAAPAVKPVLASMTMQGLLVALISILAALPSWGTMSAGEQGALVAAGAGWIWAVIGRFRKGDIKILGGKAAALFLVFLVFGMTACAATPQVAAQKGNEAGALSGGVSPTAPVNQGMSPIITNVFPVLVIGNGGVGSPTPAELSALVKAMGTTVNAGHEANGDVKAQGKQEGGGQTSTQESGQKADAKTDVAPAVGDSAIKAIAPKVPVPVVAPAAPAPAAPTPAAPTGG